MVSLDPKHSKLKKFYKLLSDFKNLKPTTTETKSSKNKMLNNMNQLYNKYLQKKYNSENLNERNGKFFDPNQFKIFG